MDGTGQGSNQLPVTDWIEVSPEMTTFIGGGIVDAAPIPPDAVPLLFSLGALRLPSTLDLGTALGEGELRLLLLVSRRALLRLGAGALLEAEHDGFHLPSDLRAIALALRDAPLSGEAQRTYRLAKSIELLCETIRLFAARALVPLASDGRLSLADTQRVIAARRLIDECCHEKLTIDVIARRCGLNRSKLTRGFREMFDCSVAEAVAERRLEQASRMLLTTDLPVSLIGYETGYLNNAAFTRAFGRRFGVSPSDYRACRIAA